MKLLIQVRGGNVVSVSTDNFNDVIDVFLVDYDNVKPIEEQIALLETECNRELMVNDELS